MLQPIQDILQQGLRYFAELTGDYGLAIILLTVAVRLILLPLTIKQMKSMQEMKRIQPMMKELQAKHKDNKEKLQEEMMKFYKEHKVNPLAGCLPLLLQLPIMLALFRVLREPLEGAQLNFLFFINDVSLSAQMAVKKLGAGAAAYLVLVLILVATTYVQSKMMSTGSEQDKMMLFMSVFMIWLGWSFPAGVVLYLVISNIWTIAQQYVSTRNSAAVAEGG